MGSRIIAAVIVVAAVAALAWVALRDDTSTQAVATAPAVNSALAAPADDSEAEGTSATAPAHATETTADEADENEEMSNTQEADATEAAEPAPTEPSADAPENYGPRMELVNIDGWLNTDATSLGEFDGKVLLIEMWTFGCFNCKARIPHNQSYYQEFAGENFEIIGVHAPEFSYEADVANIEAALVDLGVDWPIALDTDKKNFREWQPGSTNYWPRTYVIDQNGDIRYDHIGEGKYEELRETLRYLIENPPPPKA